jgi:VWFA-related protein
VFPKTRWIARIAAPMTIAMTVALPAQQNPGQQTTFRTTAEGVFSAVRVLDSRGQFVPDLRQDEFRVFEDDVEQKVNFFQTWIGGRSLQPAVAEAAPMADGLILPASKPPSDESGRIFIIFIDDLHLQALDTPRVRNVLGQIRDVLIHEGDLVGLVSSGYSSIAVDLNYDYGHVRFNESISKVMGSGMSPRDIVNMPETSEGPSGLRFNAHTAFQLAHEMLQAAAKITNRRKSFIYVSSGYDFNPFKDSRYKLEQERYGLRDSETGEYRNDISFESPFEKQGQQFADADLIADIAALTRAARRANVVFYTLDPRGLLAGPDIDTDLSIQEWTDFARTSISSLQVLGEETGGFCICNTNDFKGGLSRIDSETSDYYMIGYNSTNPDPLRISRKVRIEVTRPGEHTLFYREEYKLERPRRR